MNNAQLKKRVRDLEKEVQKVNAENEKIKQGRSKLLKRLRDACKNNKLLSKTVFAKSSVKPRPVSKEEKEQNSVLRNVASRKNPLAIIEDPTLAFRMLMVAYSKGVTIGTDRPNNFYCSEKMLL